MTGLRNELAEQRALLEELADRLARMEEQLNDMDESIKSIDLRLLTPAEKNYRRFERARSHLINGARGIVVPRAWT
jgi:uncharacterized coiled-coil protein SlyX